MFMNRHLNFGYLLVIVVAFVIAMSASCKTTHAGKNPEGVVVIVFSVEDGLPKLAFEGVIKPNNEFVLGEPIKVNSGGPNLDALNKGAIKAIESAAIVTNEGSCCFTYWSGGKEVEHCFEAPYCP